MEVFFEWVRNRFTMVDLMHLADAENDTLKLLMFNKGPSRDEFIKFLICKLLLDVDPQSEDSQKHDLEKVLVTFGLFDIEIAQQFLNCNMSTKVHIAAWNKIIEALIPTTTITPHWSNYDEMMNNIFEKNNYFRSVAKKKYLPPELISKLNDQTILNENCENIEDVLDKLANIMKKPIELNEENNKTIKNYEEHSSNQLSSEFMNLIAIKSEIDDYIKISNNSRVTSLNCEQSVKILPQELVELTKNKFLIHTNCLKSKVDDIHKLVKAEQDLQLLAYSLTDKSLK